MLFPCFMLRSTSLHAYMFRSTCFIPYAMSFYALCLFLFQVDVRVTCSHAYMMLLAMPCLDLCVYVFISMLYVQILVFTCLYAWICVLPLLLCSHLHAQMCIHMSTCIFPCLYVQIDVFTCLDPCSLYALYYLPCACALYAMFVCLDLGYV